VLVEWVDSSRGDGWATIDSIDPVAHAVRSVGWVVLENDDVIVVAPHHSDESRDAESQISGHMKIPKRCATRIADIAVPTPQREALWRRKRSPK
jgi:hypothetical protein